jgi:radical SAM superfamily enzyme YgiQ (UPF0313 family)
MKKRVIFLSDNTIRKPPGTSRYLGPYTVSTFLEEYDVEVIIIDYFTRIENFFTYIENFINEETIFVGISNTFLGPDQKHIKKTNDTLLRSEVTEFSFTGYLWFQDGKEMEDWTSELKNILHKNSPKGKLILGGSKTGFLWKLVQNKSDSINYYQNFDYIFIGKSEYSIIEIIKKELDVNYNIDTKISIKQYQTISFIFNSYERSCPITKISENQAILKNEALSIEISRGCAFNCKFCYFDKRGSEIKPYSTVYDELLYNYDKFGTTYYSITDDCFNDNKNKVFDLANLFQTLPFDIEWVCYARPDLAVKFPETLDAMIESGCKGISWGLESFNHKAAKSAGKAVPSEKIKEMLFTKYQQHKDKCFFQGTFISGLPYETEESIDETIDWIVSKKSLDFVSMGVLILSEFDPSLDKNFIDFADYVKNPQRYGFKKISFDPYYWEHETMNRKIAIDCAKKAYMAFHKNGYDTHITSIWFYPHLRYLGYNFEQIADMSRNPLNKNNWIEQLTIKENDFINRYHHSLLNVWKFNA